MAKKKEEVKTNKKKISVKKILKFLSKRENMQYVLFIILVVSIFKIAFCGIDVHTGWLNISGDVDARVSGDVDVSGGISTTTDVIDMPYVYIRN
ncbi:MAG: hypothetical protein N4A43_02375 [Alphaproteobacteria bacterium]|jgi:cell division protein FtsL|nr:hypothetical protein [Alphaproteobacteria bacterium]